MMTRYFIDHLALAAVVRQKPYLTLTEDELTRISVPVCSIIGSRDPVKAGVDTMKGKVRGYTAVIVEDADHIRAPARAEMRDALKKFLLVHRDPIRG